MWRFISNISCCQTNLGLLFYHLAFLEFQKGQVDYYEPVFLTQTMKTSSTSGEIISNSVFLGGFRIIPKELFAQNFILPSLFPDLRWV